MRLLNPPSPAQKFGRPLGVTRKNTDASKRLYGFKPIVNTHTRVMIFGSFPGVASLEKKEYYGNRLNHFWFIMSRVTGVDMVSLTYAAKRRTLLACGIGLWDVIGSCRRQGSLDQKITDCRLNNLAGLLRSHPRIKAVFFNGRTAQKFFMHHSSSLCGQKESYIPAGLYWKYLPSTSPANAGMAVQEKIRVWRKALGKEGVCAGDLRKRGTNERGVV